MDYATHYLQGRGNKIFTLLVCFAVEKCYPTFLFEISCALDDGTRPYGAEYRVKCQQSLQVIIWHPFVFSVNKKTLAFCCAPA